MAVSVTSALCRNDGTEAAKDFADARKHNIGRFRFIQSQVPASCSGVNLGSPAYYCYLDWLLGQIEKPENCKIICKDLGNTDKGDRVVASTPTNLLRRIFLSARACLHR